MAENNNDQEFPMTTGADGKPSLDLSGNNEEKTEEVKQSMSAIISRQLVEQVFTFEPDSLISGSEQGFGMYEAVLRTQGSYKRGELLMMSGNQFVKATKDGISSAESLVILADDIEVGEEEYAKVSVYSSGRFMGDAVIIPYETESDSHEELLEALKPVLMKMKIFLD